MPEHRNPAFVALCDEAEKRGLTVELDVGADVKAGGYRSLGPVIVAQPKRSVSVMVDVGFDVTLEAAAEKARGHLSKFKV